MKNAIAGFTLVLLDVTTSENVRYEIVQDYVPGSFELVVEFVNSQFLDNGDDPFDPLSLNDLCNVTFGVYNEGGSGGGSSC